MEYIKKYWYVGLLLVGTIILGISTIFISLQLQQKESVTTEDTQAAAPECSLSFTISVDTPTPSISPTPVPASCNQSCTSVFGCDAGLTCYNDVCRNPSCVNQTGCSCPTPTPSHTPSPTNTPVPGSCNATCSSNADCANSFVCSSGTCKNPQCTEQSNCACYFVPTPKVPVTGTGTTIFGMAVIAGGIILLVLGLAL